MEFVNAEQFKEKEVMDPIIKNETTYVENTFYELNKVFGKKTFRVLFILGLIFLALGILEAVFQDLVFGIILSVLGVLYSAFFPILKKVSTKSNVKKNMAKTGGTIVTYSFFNDEFCLDSVSKTSSGHDVLPYSFIDRILESDTYVFMFVNNFTAYCLDKKGFVISDLDGFRRLLTTKVKKYQKIS